MVEAIVQAMSTKQYVTFATSWDTGAVDHLLRAKGAVWKCVQKAINLSMSLENTRRRGFGIGL